MTKPDFKKLKIGKPYLFTIQYIYEKGKSPIFNAIGYVCEIKGLDKECGYIVLKASDLPLEKELEDRIADVCFFIGMDFIIDFEEIG